MKGQKYFSKTLLTRQIWLYSLSKEYLHREYFAILHPTICKRKFVQFTSFQTQFAPLAYTKTHRRNNMHSSKSNQIFWLFGTNTISRTDAIKKTLKINYKRSMHSYYSLMLQHIGKESMMNSVIKASSIVLRVICTSIKF